MNHRCEMQSIPLLPRHHPSHSPSRFLNIPFITRYQVQMHMRHGLPRCFCYIHANVVAIGVKAFIKCFLHGIQQHQASSLFLRFEVKVVCYVPLGNDERMAGAYRVLIVDGNSGGGLSFYSSPLALSSSLTYQYLYVCGKLPDSPALD